MRMLMPISVRSSAYVPMVDAYADTYVSTDQRVCGYARLVLIAAYAYVAVCAYAYGAMAARVLTRAYGGTDARVWCYQLIGRLFHTLPLVVKRKKVRLCFFSDAFAMRIRRACACGQTHFCGVGQTSSQHFCCFLFFFS